MSAPCSFPAARFSPLQRLVTHTFAVVLSALGGCATGGGTPGACKLPSRSPEAVPKFVHSSRIHYTQRDPRWSREPIGGSGKPLGAVGCTICCLSMALTQQGIEITPAELNRQLKSVDGYNSKGWVYWPAIERISRGRARAEILWHPKLHDIDRALAAGNSVIVKVAPPPMTQHWVILVGREGRDYLMRDPLDGTHAIRPLSSLQSPILAARLVEKISAIGIAATP